MSELGIDPLGGLPADIGQDAARDHVAVLVKGDAISVEKANAALTAKGYAGLNANSAEYYETRKDALLNDSEFVAAYGRGDPSAISSLYEIDLRISQASGKLTDRPLAASDRAYDSVRSAVALNVQGNSEAYSTELTELASSIGMPADSAKSLAEDHFDALRETANLLPEEKASWGEQQAAALGAAIGEGADEKIKAASKALSDKSGRKLDLTAIARSNGVRVAVNLYFQSMSIKGVK